MLFFNLPVDSLSQLVQRHVLLPHMDGTYSCEGPHVVQAMKSRRLAAPSTTATSNSATHQDGNQSAKPA
eukprot:GDKH01002896.1.p3 GENE.GDKH01002896.1~~GDKH01002896.1.p3  ORF type:complete len:69 (+),score=8.14 GDKH01002896.1:2-208(+)